MIVPDVLVGLVTLAGMLGYLYVLSSEIFWFVINAIVLELASVLVDGFDIRNFWWAFVGAIVLAIVNMILHALVPDRRED